MTVALHSRQLQIGNSAGDLSAEAQGVAVCIFGDT